MQQTIDFAPVLEQQSEVRTLGSRVINYLHGFSSDVSALLDSRSDFYSRLMEEDITWRQALRAGVVLPLLFLLAIGAVMTAPVVAVFCLACASWVTYRINKADEQSTRRTKKR